MSEESLSVVLATAGYDHTIKLWEALSGECARSIPIQTHSKQINRLAISPDKRILAAAGHNCVKLYDIHDKTNSNPIATLEAHTGNVTAVAFHCEGKWLATGSEDKTVKIWDMRTSTVQRDYAHKAAVNDVVVHPNQGEIISCDNSGSVQIWDLAGDECTHELVPAEDVPMRSVSIASDGGTLVAGNNKGDIYVWQIATGPDGAADLKPITVFNAHEKYLTRCLLSPDSKHLATCSADTTVKIWSTQDYGFKLERVLTGHQRWVWDAAFSADSAYLVTASSDHVARLWDLNSGQGVKEYLGHHRGVVAIALNDINLT